jgi:flagellin-like protein
MKGISPLLATVLLIAITLTVAAILGSWFTSLTRTQTGIIEQNVKTQVNCSSANLEIVDVTCSNTTQKIQVIITNLGNDIPLYNFSTLVILNNTYYLNNTGGPNSTSPLNPGEQAILTYFCSNTQYCIGGVKISKVRVVPQNCADRYTEKTFSDKSC